MELLSHRVVEIVQPETLSIGGVFGARKTAEAFVAALHQAPSPLTAAINAHMHASIPNFLIQKCFDHFLVPWAQEINHGVPRARDGYLEPSDARGVGVEVDEEEMAKHPYGADHFLRLFEGMGKARAAGQPPGPRKPRLSS